MKIVFVHKREDGSFEIERLWCKKLDDNQYEVDNIPFIVNRVALGDIITVEFDDEEKQYYFDSFVKTSGNSTIRLHLENESLTDEVCNILSQFGCISEVLMSRKIVAANVPKEISYKSIKNFLEAGEKEGKWEYEEPCLMHNY